MVLGERTATPAPGGVAVRMLGPDDEEAFAASNAVARVAFDDSAARRCGP